MSCKNRDCEKGMNRRGFIGFIVSVITSISVLLPLKAFSKEKWVSVGNKSDFPDGGFKVIEGEKIFVFRDGESFTAMSGKCTHFGCLVERKGDGSYLCPCHKSEFDGTGRVNKGPAKKDLVWHSVKVEPNGEVMVDVKSEVAP